MADIEKFKLTISMNATLTIFDSSGQPQDWVRPGSEAATTWHGMPSEAEVVLGYQNMAQITSATLEDVLVSVRQRLEETKRDGQD